MHADADAWLKHAVALLDGIGCGINFGAIQGVGGSADKAMRAVAWQLGGRGEGDYVAHAGQDRKITNLHREFIGLATEQFIKVEQLATLALPAHPGIFYFVENAMAVEMIKRLHTSVAVLLIEPFDQART